MLVRYKPRQPVVNISLDVLRRLNVSLLDRSIQFALNHSFKTFIEGSIIRRPHDKKKAGEFSATILICPDPSEWPEPCELYARLYCASICVAVNLAAEKEDPEACCWPNVVQKQWGTSPDSPMLATVQFGYRVAVPANGIELLRIIKRRLDLIRDEMTGVAEALANGPIPGTTPAED